jgi:hypothetical protein
MTDLQVFLKNTYGINIVIRKDLTKALNEDDNGTRFKELVRGAQPNVILPEVHEELVVLTAAQFGA